MINWFMNMAMRNSSTKTLLSLIPMDYSLRSPLDVPNATTPVTPDEPAFMRFWKEPMKSRRMVMKQALMEELRDQAISEGMTTLKQDGIWKVFKGDCDLKQVMSVCIV